MVDFSFIIFNAYYLLGLVYLVLNYFLVFCKEIKLYRIISNNAAQDGKWIR